MRKFEEVQVNHYPPCDICGEPAQYDAKSIYGPWGYFCSFHFQTETFGKLGLGFGQKLKLASEATYDHH